MCGIVGVVAEKPDHKLRKVFKEMLFYDTVRGVHSTGIVRVDTNLEVDHYKKALQASDFLQLDYPKKMVDALDSILLIGHNRAATKGKVNHENAHPFQHGNITGVHNGTLVSQYGLDNYTKFDVDSENIIFHLSQNGIEETIKELNGAFALVWYDSETCKLHMIRNSERPLSFTTTKDGKAFLFASEQWMIKVAAARNKVEINQIQELKEGVLCSIDMTLFPEAEAVEAKEVELRPKYGNTQSNYSRPSSTRSGKTEQDRLTAANQALKNKSTQSTQGKTSKFIKGDQRTVVVDRFHKASKKNTNDYDYLIIGTDSITGESVSLYVTESQYQSALAQRSKLIKATAPFLFTVYPETSTGEHPVHVLDGRSRVRFIFEDYHTNVDGQEFDDDIPFDVSGASRDNKKRKGKKGKKLSLHKETVRGFNGRFLSVKKFNEITSCGCANCSERPEVGDAGDIKWLNHDAFYCADCKELDESNKL